MLMRLRPGLSFCHSLKGNCFLHTSIPGELRKCGHPERSDQRERSRRTCGCSCGCFCTYRVPHLQRRFVPFKVGVSNFDESSSRLIFLSFPQGNLLFHQPSIQPRTNSEN